MAGVPWLYRVACGWNVAVGLPLIVAPAQVAVLNGLSPPAGALADYTARFLGGAILLFGFVYLETGRNLAAHRRFLVVCIAAKLMAVVMGGVLGALHPELLPMTAPLPVDLIFGALFFRDLRRLP